ncbi:MAG TPA: endolytic transglycosylase MltG [Fimbriimonadaceae bacterium]|nr:endolytic transglycosylase MltG [Fimbriimonadaceae bacterium]HRJ33671.1 endolytic transglycosylase MltG [Fimbriimonadaceae bacterium]
MAVHRRRVLTLLAVTGLILLAAFGLAVAWLREGVEPTTARPARPIRFESPQPLESVFVELEKMGVVRDARRANLWARLNRINPVVNAGTYEVKPGSTLEQIEKMLRRPVRRMVRIPEGLWIAQIAERLEKANVCTAQEYLAATQKPQDYQDRVNFKLPESGSLEGYLFPDTYDLPPLLSAERVVLRMLKNFESKVVAKLPKDIDLHPLIAKASMIEREAKLDSERAIIAGVIENRLARGMTLDIDATVLYGIQEWRVLGPGEVRNLPSPSNTYLNRGLPPGPIGSPSWKSIEAAWKPARHNYLFYVARPDGSHTFTTNYDDHRAAIRTNRRLAR